MIVLDRALTSREQAMSIVERTAMHIVLICVGSDKPLQRAITVKRANGRTVQGVRTHYCTGESILGLLAPRRHALLWTFGPARNQAPQVGPKKLGVYFKRSLTKYVSSAAPNRGRAPSILVRVPFRPGATARTRVGYLDGRL